MLRPFSSFARFAGAFCLFAVPGAPAASPGQVAGAAAQATNLPGGATLEEQQRHALQAIEAGHLDEARLLLDEVRAKDAKERGLWASYALLSVRENDPSAAVLDFRKELAIHPDNVGVYQPLAVTLA